MCGSAFGTTLGSVCAYLEGRGVPGEKAYVLRSIRTQLLPIAEALRTLRGTDAAFLSRGLASCRVAHAQRVDHRRAALPDRLQVRQPVHVLGRDRGDPRHLWRHVHCARCTRSTWCDDDSLVKTLRCVAEQLDHWRSGTCSMAEDAGKRSTRSGARLQRATDGARLALYVWQDVGDQERLQRQINWARIAAFPAHTLVNAFTQPNILRAIETQSLFTSVDKDSGMPPPVIETVPLSQIGEGKLLTAKKARPQGRRRLRRQLVVGDALVERVVL